MSTEKPESPTPLLALPLQLQSSERPSEDRAGPLVLEKRFRRQRVRRLQAVPILGLPRIERDQRRARRAFLRALTVAFVRKKMLDRGQQEGAETAEVGTDALQVPSLEQPREEALRQVARVLGGISLAPDKRIEGKPVGVAKLLERVPRLRTPPGPGSENEAPVRGLESAVHPATRRTPILHVGARVRSESRHLHGRSESQTSTRRPPPVVRITRLATRNSRS